MPLVLPLFFLACFMYNCVLFMENPEVKWKQFLFIPGGSRVEAKSCSCQRLAHPWALVLLPFYPHILFLPGPKWTPTWWVFCLEITEDGLWTLLHHYEFHCLLWSLGWDETPHVLDCAAAGCCFHVSAHTVELLAAVWTYDLRVSPSNFWSSVIICQRFLKMIVMPLSAAKTHKLYS